MEERRKTMKQFQFREKEISLDIAGVIVKVPATTDYAKQMEVWGKRMGECAEKMDEEGIDIDALTEQLEDILEEMLGPEAVDRIFADREEDLYDCIDLIVFVTDAVTQYHIDKANSYQKKEPVKTTGAPAIPMNRAQRRAARRQKA